jgi:hypothetical protein
MADYNAALQIAFLQHQANEEREEQTRVVAARDLYDGMLSTSLATELAAAMLSGTSSDVPELINIYRTRIEEIEARLTVSTFHNKRQIDGQPEQGERVEWAEQLWSLMRLDERQHEIHRACLRDGETFLILNTTPQGLWPVHHERYTDAQAGGSGTGCKAHIDPETQLPTFFSKRWQEWIDVNGTRTPRQRMTLYIAADGELPARIEKYKTRTVNDQPDSRFGGLWITHQDDEDKAWPLWWTDTQTQTGNSLPLPIIHFRNIAGDKTGDPMRGPQAVLDNLITALIAAAGVAGAGALSVIGGYPTTDGEAPDDDGGNVWRLGPRAIVGFPDKKPSDAAVMQMKPADLTQLQATIDNWVSLTAVATGTTSLLAKQIGRINVAARALQQTDIRPIANTRRAQSAIGNAWTAFFATYTTILDAYYKGSDAPQETTSITPTEETVFVNWMAADVLGMDAIPEDHELAELETEAETENDT